jgi:beta-ureidopropionase / N-carbamoyl-L-amino-acid hydrolase
MALNAQRTLDDLKELRRLTQTEEGAQRVALTEVWKTSVDWFEELLASLPVEVTTDAAGNIWATLEGESEDTLVIGGHLDSVGGGGWLDGCLNVLAGLEVIRRIASEGKPPITIKLVSWQDEEGSRWGRSLLGSSAFSGTLEPDKVRDLVDKDGIKLVDALAKYGINFDKMLDAHEGVKNVKAYLELHIEQGPVLESMNLPMGTVLGTYGVERHSIRFTGQAAHSGSTPMDKRRDALGAAAKLSLEIREIAKRNGGVCTVGRVETKPGIVTSVVAQCDMTLDQRHLNADSLAKMLQEAKDASERFAQEEKCEVEWSKLWEIHPILFDPHLIELADEAIMETCGVSHRLPSGPLHDAAEVARAGIPTIMLFVQSLYGISHNKIEDTKEEHILMSVEALDRLATKTIAWIQGQ